MRNGLTYVLRITLLKLWIVFQNCRMNLPIFVQNFITAFNSIGRNLLGSRKVVLGLLILLAILYYLGPLLFGSGSEGTKVKGFDDECLNINLLQYESRVAQFDAFVYRPTDPNASPVYVGNGKISVAVGSTNGLFIRKYRALSQPVLFWPLVQTRLEGEVKEASVLDVRSGLAYKMQALSTPTGCVNVGSQVYAHRSRSSLLVQDIRIRNPTMLPVVVEIDQIGASGWTGVQIKEGSFTKESGEVIKYKIYSGVVPIDSSNMAAAIAIATVNVDTTMIKVEPKSTQHLHVPTTVHYTKPIASTEASKYLPDLILQTEGDLQDVLKMNDRMLRLEHTQVWAKLWATGVGISHSKAAGAINGDRINQTIYYVVSNAPAPLHDVTSSAKQKTEVEKVLYFPDRCYKGHSTIVSQTLWINPLDETQVAGLVTTWMITLEKQGCKVMVQAGAEGILQAMVLSLGPLHFDTDHLEMPSHPKDLHRDLHFRRINYGNNTHLNISVVVGEDNKAMLWAGLDRNDKPYYGCDAGCLDPPVQLGKELHQFPVKLTDPFTPVLYITADKGHMEELKHAIHVKEIVEAPAHEHHVIALHKHGHHFGGLPTIFWVSIAFLIVVFHLFLFKLIYNEYCGGGQDRFGRSRYNL